MRTRRGNPIARIVAWATAFALVAPIFVAIAMSLTTSDSLEFPPSSYGTRWYESVVSDPMWHDRLWTSLQTALIAALAATVVGTLTAYGVSRAPSKIGVAMSALMIAPLAVPVVVLGTGDYFVWASGWNLGPLHVGGRMVGTIPGLALAHAVIALPYPFVTVRTSLAGFDTTLEKAAQGLGAKPLTVFRTITLPLIAPGVLSGAVFAFIASWDEVVIASFLSTSHLTTIPVQIYNKLREALDPSAAVISTLLLVVSLVLLGTLGLIGRRTPRSTAGQGQ